MVLYSYTASAPAYTFFFLSGRPIFLQEDIQIFILLFSIGGDLGQRIIKQSLDNGNIVKTR